MENNLTVLVGLQWGDEGKGRMVDYLAQNADFVARYQGGNNAGHTVVNQFGTFKLHLIPSGIFNPGVINILGPGMVIDIQSLSEEIAELEKSGINTDSIRISDRATVTFPFHRLEDNLEEDRLGGEAFGSTRRGIAYAYSERYLKKSIQLGELLYPDHLKKRMKGIVEWKNLLLKNVYKSSELVKLDSVLEWLSEYGEKIKHLICDTTSLLEKASSENKKILFEAQLGSLRDIYFGIYPFTTSSCTLASYAPVGGGLFNKKIENVIGVMKAYSTCVGSGPFTTEMQESEAKDLRETAFEYGASTGRPRRIGHFDAVATRYGAMIQGTNEIAITKVDSLSGQKKLLICNEYEINGKSVTDFPLTPALEIANPKYIEMDGWSEDISKCRNFNDLPAAAKNYINKIEELIGYRIRYVSVGPERESLILK
ncbi:MAG: adenylosuccinate synthase [Ignavibacteria bacterium]|nr:adenylosuccinate synthase [Ignavibacteria bacterium]MBK7446918.1 adenylosuccinate synthase [Ignavibacteria bacterium]MBK9405364.1 adenylosuccinate synthase [Ignavibacteria bacterium]